MGRSVLLYNSSTILTMPLLRPYAAFSSFTRRAAPRSIRQSAAARPISSTCARFAQGYGEGEGTGAGPTKSGGKSSKSESPEEKSKDGAAPKITDHDVPGSGNSKAKQAEVEQRNKEFEQGHDRAPPAAEDKVDKKFWQGKGGSADHE